MTENKRYTTDNGSNEDVCLVDNVTGKEFESDFDEIVDLLNEQEETTQRLKEIREEQIQTILKQKRKIKELERHIERNTISRITVEDVLSCAKDKRFCDNEEIVKAIDCIAKDLGVNLY